MPKRKTSNPQTLPSICCHNLPRTFAKRSVTKNNGTHWFASRRSLRLTNGGCRQIQRSLQKRKCTHKPQTETSHCRGSSAYLIDARSFSAYVAQHPMTEIPLQPLSAVDCVRPA